MYTPNHKLAVPEYLGAGRRSTQTLRWTTVALLALFSAGQVFAQDAEDEEEKEEVFELNPFVVSTTDDRGYFSANSTSITRTNEAVKNTPISLTVINEQLLEDLGAVNDEDLEGATSVVSRDPDGFSFNQIRIRGFRSLTQRYDLFYRDIERDFYNVARTDIIKGANSLMYGQADPGGQVNAVPKKAMLGRSFYGLNLGLGNKEYHRATLDANVVVNDKVALRLMGVDYAQNLDQRYASRTIAGATLEGLITPWKGTSLRFHLEHIDAEIKIPRRMFVDATGGAFFLNNSIRWPEDNFYTQTLTAYKFEYLFSHEGVQYLPQGLIEDLRLTAKGPDYVPTRADLEELYAPWADKDELYSVTGPDAKTDRRGEIYTFEITQRITSDLQFKVALNHETNMRDAIDRNGYSSTRVRAAKFKEDGSLIPTDLETFYGDIPYEPVVTTFWQRHTDDTDNTALKSTLLWNFEVDNDKLLGKNKHTLLLGFDWDLLEKHPISMDQLDPDAALYPGDYSYDNLEAQRRTVAELATGNYPGNFYYFEPEQRRETFRLADGFGPEVPGIRYNGQDQDFYPRTVKFSEVQTLGYWTALQSQFFNGRLRTLFGVRYDEIDISHSFQKNVVWVQPNRFEANWAKNADGSALSIDDLNRVIEFNDVKFDKTSPSLGGLFWITEELAVFGNYAESIQSPTGVTVDPFGDVVPPVFGEGYEYGLRFELFDSMINGQISAFYIEKENDDIVNYDFLLGQIITYEEYGDIYPEYFIWQPSWGDSGRYFLEQKALPSTKIAGDRSRAEGMDIEFYFNPTKKISAVFSYTYNNLDAIYVHPAVQDLRQLAQVYGIAPHQAVVHFRYKHDDRGPLAGLTWGISQQYRSPSIIRSYYIDGEEVASPNGLWYDVEFDEEWTTSGFFNYRFEIGKSRFTFTYRVTNLFGGEKLRNRSRTTYYAEGTQHKLEFGWYW
jgi:outer membrane receptor protein involved in Fe transport